MTPDIKQIFLKVHQKFAPDEPYFDMFDENTLCKHCSTDRWGERWEQFFGHEHSGPCYTYNPPRKSVAGATFNLKMIFSES